MADFDPLDTNELDRRAKWVASWKGTLFVTVWCVVVYVLSVWAYMQIRPDKTWQDAATSPVFVLLLMPFCAKNIINRDQFIKYSPVNSHGISDSKELQEVLQRERITVVSSVIPSFMGQLPLQTGKIMRVPEGFVEGVSEEAVQWSMLAELRRTKRLLPKVFVVVFACLVICYACLFLSFSSPQRLWFLLTGLFVLHLMIASVIWMAPREGYRIESELERKWASEVLQFAVNAAVPLKSKKTFAALVPYSVRARAKGCGVDLIDPRVGI
jgi:hypothetical protein